MPLLFFNDLADLAGLPRDQALHQREQEAIDSVLDMQNYAGNFGMWGPGSDAEPWISVFALDFLYQAKQKGFVVPSDGLKRGASWLKSTASSDSADDNARATTGATFFERCDCAANMLRIYASIRIDKEQNLSLSCSRAGVTCGCNLPAIDSNNLCAGISRNV